MRGTLVTDTFTRTLASGWGSADTGQAWTSIGAGGTINATDWSVGSGLGVHSVPVANAYRMSYLAGFSQAFADVAVTVKVNRSPIVGGPVEPANLITRATDTVTYYLFRLQIEVGGALTAKIFAPGGAQLASITVPGITYTGTSQLIRVRAQSIGRIHRMKAWDTSKAEPAAWVLSATDSTYLGAGFVGIRSGVSPANTNTLPIVFSYDDFASNLLPDFPKDKLPLTVLAAFGADLSADPSTWPWTNITADVRAGSVSVTPGRRDETSQASPASCSFQLKNATRAYSANNPMSPNYPNVKRNTPIWVIVDPSTRFMGYANGFVPSWDTTGKVAVVSVSASGILRRLMQGRTPVKSPLRRAVTARPDLRAYWPMEDKAGALSAASGMPGGQSMTTNGLTFGADSTHPGSEPLPKFSATSSINATVAGTFAGQWQVDWYYRIPADPMPNEVKLMSVPTTDVSVAAGMRWDVVVGGPNPTVLTVRAVNSAGTQVVNAAITIGAAFFGQWVHAFLTVHQVGANIAWEMYVYPVGSFGQFFSGTVAGTVGGPTAFTVPPDSNLNGMSIGHVSVLDAFRARVGDMAQVGHVGEPPSLRVARLCTEQGVPVSITPGTETVTEDFAGPLLRVPFTGTWALSLAQAHSGIRSLGSAPIGDGQKTDAVLNLAGGATSATFWYMVSSETNFDVFQIIRDGVVESQFSGTVPWTQRTVSLVGVNQLIFRYVKDASTLAGSDAAWIDDLTITGPSAVRMGTQGVDTFVNLLRECEAADLGLLYDGFGPGLGYITRSARYNMPAALTLDVTAGQVAPPFAPADDDQRNRNLWTVDRKGGSSATYEDKTGPLGTDPVKGIGTYDSSTTLNVATDDVLPSYASWLVHMGTVEGFRYPSLNLDLAASPELIDDWVAARLNSRIDVLNVSGKATGHAPGTVSLLSEGYTETLGPKTWKAAATCSRYDPWRVFVLGTDRLEADPSSRLVADITATATTFQVSTSATVPGALWTTDAAEWTSPKTFYINMDGEQMQVTAITGAATPQTFTVVRAVNGVSKTHKANAFVGIWQPRVLAL